MSVGLGTAVGYLNLDITGFARGVDSAISDMNRLQSSANTLSGAFTTVGSALSKTGAILTAGITAPIVGATAASVKFGTDFDAQMSNVKAVSSATAQEFEGMRDAAISWGEKTVYTATEAGEALYYMGLAGWDANKSMEGLGPILNLAAAGNLELGRTSDIVTDAMTALKLSAGELNKDGIENTIHFTNALSAAMSHSNTDVEQMGMAFKYVAPLAGSLGFEVNDLALALGLMANVGVKSSQAGTGLRQALNGLINPTEKAAMQMDNYGISLFNADGSTKNFRQVMLELRSTFGDVGVNAATLGEFIDGLGYDLDTAEGEAAAADAIMQQFGHDLPINDFEKLNAIIQIFGIRALPGVLGIIEQSDDAFNKLAEAIDGSDAAFVKYEDQIYTMQEALEKFGDAVYTDKSFEILGSAAGMAQVQMDNLKGDWTRFTSALGTSQIIISDMAKGALRELVQRLTEIVQWFNNLDSEQQEQIMKWAMIAASIGPVLLVIGKLITGVVGLVNNIRLLGTAFSTIGTAITHVKEAFVLAKAGLTGFAGETSALGTALAGITGPMIAIGAAIAALIAAFVTLWQTNEEFRAKMVSIWEGIQEKVSGAFQKIVDAINSLGFEFTDIVEVLKAAWMGFCDLLAPLFEGAFAIIGEIIGYVANMIADTIQVIAGIIKGFKDGDWSLFWEGLANIVTDTIDAILGILDALGEAIWGVIQTIAGWFGADWDMTWEEAKQAVADWFNSVVEWVTALPGKIADFFSNLWQSITNFFTNIWDNVTSWFENLIAAAIEFGSNFIDGIITFFTELPGNVWNFLVETYDSVVQWASDMVQKAIEMGTDFLASVVEFFTDLPYQIGYFIGYALGTVIKWVTDMVTKAREMASTFLENVVEFFTQLPGKILEFITSAWNNVIQWAANMIQKAKDMAQTFLNNVIAFFQQLPGKILEFITSAWNNVVQWATNMVNKAKEMAQNFLNNVISFFQQLPGKILEFITSAWNNVVQWATNMINKAREMAQNFLNNVVSYLQQLPGKVQEQLTSALNKVIQWVSDMGAKGREAAQELINKFKEGAANVAETVKSIGQNMVDGVWKGIQAAKDAFVNNVKSFFKGIVDGVKDSLGINSPSTVMADEIGYWMPMGASQGFVRAVPGAMKMMQDAFNRGIDDMSLDDISMEDELMRFVEVYQYVFEGLVMWYETMEERMYHTVENLRDYFEYMFMVGQMIENANKLGGYITIVDRPPKPNPVTGGAAISTDDSGRDGGDTFIFYSNEPIDEIQAAKLLRDTKRDMAEGF